MFEQLELDGWSVPQNHGRWNCLVACEESQAVTTELRKLGHRAFSCDLQECSGGHPEWHINGDCLPLIDGDCEFITTDGKHHKQIGEWDLLIAHPPCTYLTVSGNRWFNVEKYGEKATERERERERAIDFFMKFVNAKCQRIAIENPVGVMSRAYRKPSQIIQPYEYGHPTRKTTCLWLKGLPNLMPTKLVEPEIREYVCKNGKIARFGVGIGQCYDENGKAYGFNDPMTAKLRSKTFPGIAKAMAEQWAGEIERTNK